MDSQDSVRLAGLFDAHAVAVYRYVCRRVGDVSVVDDLVSEVFLVAARRIRDVPVGGELPWLYVTARNVTANWRRRVVPVVADDAFLERVAGVGVECDVGDGLVLRGAWLSLSERDREVLRLAAWEGLSGGELAAALGVSSGGAASALSRARSRLAAAVALAS